MSSRTGAGRCVIKDGSIVARSSAGQLCLLDADKEVWQVVVLRWCRSVDVKVASVGRLRPSFHGGAAGDCWLGKRVL